ncbi:hypothetical protein D9M68_831140 [compost metagenome]
MGKRSPAAGLRACNVGRLKGYEAGRGQRWGDRRSAGWRSDKPGGQGNGLGWRSALRLVSIKGIGAMVGMLHPRLVVMGPVAGLIDWMAGPMPTLLRLLAVAAGD